MFESAELGHSLTKEEYAQQEPGVRKRLLDAQFELGQQKRFPVVILCNGVDGAGKGEVANLLNEWMDPRHIFTHAFGAPSAEDAGRPTLWRYWRALPPKGKMGILIGNWYTQPILDRAQKRSSEDHLGASLDLINRFEQMLVAEGALVLKFWFHLSKDAQRNRLRALEKDPKTRWRVTPTEWERFESYARYRKVCEHVLGSTSTGWAPWTVVEGLDKRYRSITTAQTLLRALEPRLAQAPAAAVKSDAHARLPAAGEKRHVLNSLTLKRATTKEEYSNLLEEHQGRINQLCRSKAFGRRSLVVVFEGNDAAGKGGAIRRVTQALDARWYRVAPVAAPTEEERAQPYLWRFWRRLPPPGCVTMFDRSWYGRVLVERVEGFCAPEDWMRAYQEINDFERQLQGAGTVVVKFWLAISQAEQLRRFKEREGSQFKRFKITQEDYRNRKKWPQYEQAVCDMIDRTSTPQAPWTLVEADNKYYARIKVLKTLCAALDAQL